MKTQRLFWLLSGAPLFLVPFSGGCSAITAYTPFLQAPTPIPTPTLVPTPEAPFFDPAAGQLPGTRLNKPNDPIAPDAYRIASPITGDTVALQSVDTVKTGNPPRDIITVGPSDTVKLAGILAPTSDPGLQGARSAISGWTAGQNLDVDRDPKFPSDLSGMEMVQIYFKGRKLPPLPANATPGKTRRSYENVTLSLNRMLVRSGWAVVDLYSPTSFDTSQWLLDEAHARNNKLGFWKFGQVVQQRVPVKVSNGARPRTGTRSNVTVLRSNQAGKIGAGATGTTQTTQTTQTTTSQTTVQSGSAVPPSGAVAPAGAVPTSGPVPGAVPPATR